MTGETDEKEAHCSGCAVNTCLVSSISVFLPSCMILYCRGGILF